MSSLQKLLDKLKKTEAPVEEVAPPSKRVSMLVEVGGFKIPAPLLGVVLKEVKKP